MAKKKCDSDKDSVWKPEKKSKSKSAKKKKI
jgi:hypothetical protein